jgi:hypothetical protein
MNNQWNRREFIKKSSAATLAAFAAGAPLSSLLSSCNNRRNAKADTVILLWMAGEWLIQIPLILNDTPLSAKG